MSTSIDSKVVEARFDSAQFERGVQKVLEQLANLKKGMQLEASANKAARSLAEINTAAARVDLNSIAKATEHVASKFNAMTAIATAAITRLTFEAVNAAGRITRSMMGSITEGYSDYELKLGATQTVMAGTGETIGFVSKQLKELDIYADETIYSLADMVNNIGKFTNAGVKLPVAVEAMKGISNVAAISGAGTQEAAMAMYNLGQAIGQGTVRLMDWRSVELANMGTKEFKEELIKSAEAMGTLTRNAKGNLQTMEGNEVTYKNFTSTLQDQWLTSEALIDTLNRYSDTSTDIGRRATKAATQVKSFSMMMTTLKAAAGTGWTDTFELVIGKLPEATKLWTRVTGVIGGAISASADARNNMLKAWKDLGGRKAMIDALSNAFGALMSVLKPIYEAFREIFPRTTGRQLYNITIGIRDFFEKLKMGEESAENLKSVFKGVFAIFSIGLKVVKGVAGFFADIFGFVSGGATAGFLSMASGLGDFLSRIDEALEKGKIIENFFGGLSGAVEGPIKYLKDLFADLLRPFSKFRLPETSEIMAFLEPLARIGPLLERGWDGVEDILDRARGPLISLAAAIADGWGGIIDILENAWAAIGRFASNIGQAFGSIGPVIKEGFQDIDYKEVTEGVRTGLLAGFYAMFLSFMRQFRGVANDARDLIEVVKGPFNQLTDVLKTMQTSIRANIVLKIAAAVALLAGSVFLLSGIPAADLLKATSAVGALFAMIAYAMKNLTKIGGEAGIMALSAGMVGISIAVRILASAIKSLADVEPGALMRGLLAIVTLLGAIVGMSHGMKVSESGMIATGIGMAALAVGVRILVGAVKSLAELSWEELAKGLVGVGTILAALGLFMKLSAANEQGLAQGAGLLMAAVGIRILAEAVERFGLMDTATLVKGLAVVGLVLLAFNRFMSGEMTNAPAMIASAGAILLISGAMNLMADALIKMGAMSWTSIAKGLITMGVSLALLNLTMRNVAAPKVLVGAAAMIIVVLALDKLADVLAKFGAMGWGEIIKGLIGLGGSLLAMGLAVHAFQSALPGAIALAAVTYALAQFLPVFIALSKLSWAQLGFGLLSLVAIFVVLGLAGLALGPVVPILMGLGIAIFALGAGLALVGAGALLFGMGLAAIAASAAAAGIAIIAFIKDLIKLIPFFFKYLAKAVAAFATELVKQGPEFFRAMEKLIDQWVKSARKSLPKVVNLIMDMLEMIWKRMEKSVPKMADSFGKMLFGIFKAMDKWIPKIVDKISDMIAKILWELAAHQLELVNAGIAVMTEFIRGLTKNIDKVTRAAADLIIEFFTSLQEESNRVFDAAGYAIVAFLNGLTVSINKHAPAIREAAGELAVAIIDGMTAGLASKAWRAIEEAKGLAGRIIAAVANRLDAHSPSREFKKLGQWAAEGLAQGLVGGKSAVIEAWGLTMALLKTANNDAIDEIKRIEDELKELRKGNETAKEAAKIKKLEKALLQARRERDATSDAIKKMKNSLDDEQRRLKKLGERYDSYSAQIRRANERLKEAKQVRDDYNDSIVDSYDDLPDISDETGLDEYIKNLGYSNDRVALFMSTLQKLRKLGLSDTMYKELLDKGLDALPLAEEILNGGKNAVKEVNNLSSDLAKKAKALGDMASTSLYQAGVNSAQGLVDGLNKKRNAIARTMRQIAREVVQALRKELKIKSPSRVMFELGGMITRGLAIGIRKSSSFVDRAAVEVSRDALESMKSSLSNVSDQVAMNLDANPTITPVLDLSNVTRGAATMTSLLADQAVSVDATYSGAAYASSGYEQNRLAALEAMLADDRIVPGDVTYNQYNQSPKALSEAEIYRRTRSQLSTVKEVLAGATTDS